VLLWSSLLWSSHRRLSARSCTEPPLCDRCSTPRGPDVSTPPCARHHRTQVQPSWSNKCAHAIAHTRTHLKPHAHSCTREGRRLRVRDRVAESSSSLEASPFSQPCCRSPSSRCRDPLVHSAASCRTRAHYCRAGIPFKVHAFLYPNQAIGSPRLHRDAYYRATVPRRLECRSRRASSLVHTCPRIPPPGQSFAFPGRARASAREFVRQHLRITSDDGQFLTILLSCPFVMCAPSDSCRCHGSTTDVLHAHTNLLTRTHANALTRGAEPVRFPVRFVAARAHVCLSSPSYSVVRREPHAPTHV
jgi:hypothetical protein